MITTGIHHITVISSNAQKTYDFYTKVLGLRLVKKTVNQDAPDVLHLYFGDKLGVPGTGLTFFPFEDAGTGMRGVGQVTTISFAIPKSSLGFWIDRFIQKGVKHNQISDHFGQKSIVFYDFDDLQLELVATDEKFETEPYEHNEINKENSILGFYSATLSVDQIDNTQKVLEKLGYSELEKEDFSTRFINKEASFAKYIVLFRMSGWPKGIQSAGTVHHIAFTVETDEAQLVVADKMREIGLQPTEVIDRFYFKSIYYREPENILFELATREPGFTIDEDESELGQKLVLPPRFERLRPQIERSVPILITNESEFETQYLYKFTKGTNNKLLILFHGTGGSEKDLISFVGSLDPEASILSLRGDVNENGNLRFFKRFDLESFDEEDIQMRVENLKNFLGEVYKKHELEDLEKIFVGFSNGANFIAATMLQHPKLVSKAILMRATIPLRQYSNKKAIKHSKVLILSGKKDELIPLEKTELLKKALTEKGFDVTSKITGEDHSLSHQDSSEMFDFLNSRDNE